MSKNKNVARNLEKIITQIKDNEIFEAGLTYPAPSQKKAVDIADSYTSASQTVNYSAPSQKVKKAVNIANYNSPNAPAAVPPKYKPSSPAKAAYKKPTYEAPAPAPAYQAPEKQTYKTSKKKPTYKVASPKDPIKPSYETPAVPPSYEKPKPSKPVSFPTSSFNSQLTDSFPSGSQNSYSAANKVATKPSAKPSTATPRPVYRAPSTTTPATTTTSATTTTTTTASTTTTRSQYTYKASPAPSVTSSFRGSPTPRPFYGSPTPYYTPAPSYGSPTPTPYTYAPAPQVDIHILGTSQATIRVLIIFNITYCLLTAGLLPASTSVCVQQTTVRSVHIFCSAGQRQV